MRQLSKSYLFRFYLLISKIIIVLSFLLPCLCLSDSKNIKILFIPAGIANGQISMAEGLREAIKADQHWSPEVQSILFEDTLTDGSRMMMVDKYIEILRKMGPFSSDKDSVHIKSRRMVESLSEQSIYQFNLAVLGRSIDVFAKQLNKFLPDIVVAYLPATIQAIKKLKEEGRLKKIPRVIYVAPDFPKCRMFAPSGADLIISGNKGQQDYFIQTLQRDPKSVALVHGLVPRKDFLLPLDRIEMKKKFGFEENKPLLLISGGGEGFALEKIISYIPHWAPDEPVNVAVVSGKAKDIKSQVEAAIAQVKNKNLNIKSFGFIDNFHELQYAADVLISKPGASTIAEASATGHGLLVVDSTHYAEEANFEVLRTAGAAVKIDPSVDLNHISRLKDLAKNTAEGMSKLYPKDTVKGIAQEVAGVIRTFAAKNILAKRQDKATYVMTVDSAINFAHAAFQEKIDLNMMQQLKTTDTHTGKLVSWFDLNLMTFARVIEKLKIRNVKGILDLFASFGLELDQNPFSIKNVGDAVVHELNQLRLIHKLRIGELSEKDLEVLVDYLHGTYVASLAADTDRNIKFIHFAWTPEDPKPFNSLNVRSRYGTPQQFVEQKAELKEKFNNISEGIKRAKVKVFNFSGGVSDQIAYEICHKLASRLVREKYDKKMRDVAKHYAKSFKDGLIAVVEENPDTVFVFAAGNEGLSLERGSTYSSEVNAKNVITVGGIDAQGKLYKPSNFGPAVDVLAPAVGVPGARVDQGITYMSGTSVAAPIVASKVAEIRADYPTLSAEEAIQEFYKRYTRTSVELEKLSKQGKHMVATYEDGKLIFSTFSSEACPSGLLESRTEKNY